MTYGEAIQTLIDIPTGNNTTQQILRAVKKIRDMSMINAVSKEALLNAVAYLADELEGKHK